MSGIEKACRLSLFLLQAISYFRTAKYIYVPDLICSNIATQCIYRVFRYDGQSFLSVYTNGYVCLRIIRFSMLICLPVD